MNVLVFLDWMALSLKKIFIQCICEECSECLCPVKFRDAQCHQFLVLDGLLVFCHSFIMQVVAYTEVIVLIEEGVCALAADQYELFCQ